MATTVGDIIRRGLPVLAPDETRLEAAHRLNYEGMAALPACDGERVLGTLSDRDITLRAVATGLDPDTTQVQQPMRTDIAWSSPRLVVQVAFTEWTSDGKFRHPALLGLRDDKPPHAVVREPVVPPLSPGDVSGGSR